MLLIVICLDGMNTVRNEEKIEGKLVHGLGQICPVIALLIFQNFNAQMTMKLMYICCIWCVESFYQKSFELVEQNLRFRKLKKPGKRVQAV